MAYTAIDDPGSFYNALLYTGTGATYALTGLGFQPDFVWIKCRDAGSRSHIWTDSVRGTDSQISCDDTLAETTFTDAVTAFGADGFTLGADTGNGEVNESTDTFIGWNWKAGSTTGSAGSPTITPSGYSFNQTSGFSVIAYTGTMSLATLPHGLGVKPDLIITKQFNTGRNWSSYWSALGATHYIKINASEAIGTSSAYWNDTEPDTTVFTVKNQDETNGSGTMIAYCFTSIQGYSKMSSYIGNGNANGVFVYTGFRPAWLMIKNEAGSEDWHLYDNKRSTYNVVNRTLDPNQNTVGYDIDPSVDFVSNGFKLRGTATAINGSGASYLFAAFAESPFVNSSSVPCNAR